MADILAVSSLDASAAATAQWPHLLRWEKQGSLGICPRTNVRYDGQSPPSSSPLIFTAWSIELSLHLVREVQRILHATV